jgi:amidase
VVIFCSQLIYYYWALVVSLPCTPCSLFSYFHAKTQRKKTKRRNELPYFAPLRIPACRSPAARAFGDGTQAGLRPGVKKYIMKVLLFTLFLSTTIFAKCQNAPVTKTHYNPTSFSNSFSLNREPVLKIRSGDTVSTETIDAGGFDKNGVKRQKPGNPLTGPFFIADCAEGDVLAVTITKLDLNRSTAFTSESFSFRAVPKTIAKEVKEFKRVIWNLDTVAGFATVNDTSYKNLQNFKVPLKPFLGCIGVVPSNKKNEILSFFQGAFGGNMDFEGVTHDATVYLPVFHEGAYLYIGDGHALQGHGEIAGNALETSLDVTFTVRVIKKEVLSLNYPRLEDATYIMATGFDKSLDEALKIATNGLLEWLQQDYHLSLQEATQVMSTSIEYTIAEIADPEVEVVAKIKKEILKALKKYN